MRFREAAGDPRPRLDSHISKATSGERARFDRLLAGVAGASRTMDGDQHDGAAVERLVAPLRVAPVVLLLSRLDPGDWTARGVSTAVGVR